MRMVSWNCCGKLREKFSLLQEICADIIVVQECENPEVTDDATYKKFAENHIWRGDKPGKGLGIFAKSNIKIEQLEWDNHLLRHFIPVRINEDFILLAVWACRPYIEEYAVYQDIHYDKYENSMIIIGDFNSNKIWDNKRVEYRSHSSVVGKLSYKGLHSAYHFSTGEDSGGEETGTFYLYRNIDRKYHIDYCFIDPKKIKDFAILGRDFWLKYSDHIPIVLEI